MRDFVSAALPWVLCGIAVAILCAAEGNRKEKAGKPADQNIVLGLALGLMLSPALNSLGLWENHGVGLALGPLWGMALAALFESRGDHGEN